MTSLSLHARKLAAVGYIPLLSLVIWYGHHRDAFIRWHAVQGSAVSLYLILAYLLPVVGPYLALACSAVSVIGFIRAMHGHVYRVPLLGDFLDLLVAAPGEA